jgi:hypothetical protein
VVSEKYSTQASQVRVREIPVISAARFDESLAMLSGSTTNPTDTPVLCFQYLEGDYLIYHREGP